MARCVLIAEHLEMSPWLTHRLFVGQSQFLTTPVPARPLSFNLALDDYTFEDEIATRRIEDSDNRLMEMLAAQAAHRDGFATEDEDEIAKSERLPAVQKRDLLQKALNMAASNGDVERIRRIVNGKAKEFVDLDAPDEEGTAPLIYASCFVSDRWEALMEYLLTTA
jgi:hypothetical protein